MTELVVDNATYALPAASKILFSYQTPVAGWDDEGAFETETKYSVTTSKHISKYFGGKERRQQVARKVPQSFIDNLAGAYTMKTTEIELTKYGECVLLTYEYRHIRAAHACERETLDILPLTLQRFSEDTGEPLVVEVAGDLYITDYINEQIAEAIT